MNRNIILGMIGAAIAVAVAIVLVLQPGRGTGGDLAHVTFATDWKAQAEHGGFYQALAKGYYREAGLDVEILQGGPGVNVPLLVLRGNKPAEMTVTSTDRYKWLRLNPDY